MDHSENGLSDRHFSSACIDKGRLSVLYFLADVSGTPFDWKDVFGVVAKMNQRLMSPV